MAEEKKFTSYENLQQYDTLIKETIVNEGESTLAEANAYTDAAIQGTEIKTKFDENGVLFFMSDTLPYGDEVSY